MASFLNNVHLVYALITAIVLAKNPPLDRVAYSPPMCPSAMVPCDYHSIAQHLYLIQIYGDFNCATNQARRDRVRVSIEVNKWVVSKLH